MADFQTHIGASTVCGLAYAAWGYTVGVPIETAALSAGMCSISGMLPDLDSDAGVPSRESFAFLSAVVPALMLDRFQQLGWTNETIALATGAIYFLVRFGVAELFRRFTVHRGMWHSIPACAIAGLLTFTIAARERFPLRTYIAVAVMIGFFSHLLLDEIWALQLTGGKVGVKKSWGTAMKFFGDSYGANFATYLLLLVVGAAAFYDPVLMHRMGHRQECPWLTWIAQITDQEPDDRGRMGQRNALLDDAVDDRY